MVAYFAYHAMNGDRGFYAWILLKQEQQQVMAKADSLEEERGRLERRVALLRGATLDPDLLEEQAHAILNYGAERDHVIFLEPALQRSPALP